MTWVKLSDFKESTLWPGTVFRFPAKHPFEPFVDFMLFSNPNSESSFSFLCTTGYHAGSQEGHLPKEARASGDVVAIHRDWLIENWNEWVYQGTPVSEVYIISNYPAKISD